MKDYRYMARMASRYLFMLVVALIFGISAYPLASAQQNALPIDADRVVLSLQALQHDPVLNRVVAMRFDEARLDDVCKALADQRGLKLTVVSDLAPRKISARCKYAPVANFMIALSRVLDVSWRKYGNSYNLFQTSDQIRSEARKRRASEVREQSYIEAQGNKLRSQVQGALLQRGAQRDAFSDFLAGFDSNIIDRGVVSALEDEPTISAVDQRHFHNHFLSATPLSTLNPVQQASVRQITRDGGYSHLSAESSVGLIAAAGGFRLGVVEPDGRDVWVAPQHSIGQVNTVNPEVRENDFDRNVVEQLRSKRLVDFGVLTNTLRHKRMTPAKKIDRSRLAVQLQDMAAQADVDFLCDCYLNSAVTPHVYQPDPAWTAEDALTWIARTFGHKMIYHNGLLEIATVIPGLDLRLEPPAAVMNSLDAQVVSGLMPNRQDRMVLSLCTREQLQLLNQRHPVLSKTHTGHIFQALRSYPFLHFYGSLSAKQQSDARLERGARISDMSVAQQRLFAALFTVGLKNKTLMWSHLEKNRFYLKFSSITWRKGNLDVITFIATSPEDAAHYRSALL